MEIRGVVCAGGRATRLGILTHPQGGQNKHLLAIGDRPMIFYPLKTLEQAGIKKICLVTGREHAGDFANLLGDGEVWTRNDIPESPPEKILDLDLTYKVQAKPGGIAQAIGLAEDFAGSNPIVVMLGDNIIQGNIIHQVAAFRQNPERAIIVLKEVPNPRDYGVVELDDRGKITSIEEKPQDPKSNFAVIGIYMYPPGVFQIIRKLKPSPRGELEVTDINRKYLSQNRLDYVILRGWWHDAGRDERSLSTIGSLVFETGANDPNL